MNAKEIKKNIQDELKNKSQFLPFNSIFWKINLKKNKIKNKENFIEYVDNFKSIIPEPFYKPISKMIDFTKIDE